MMKKILLIIFITWGSINLFAQSGKFSYTDPIDLRFLNADSLASLVLKIVNKQLEFNNHEPLRLQKILMQSAQDQADFMADIEMATLEQGGKKQTTQDRLIYYGGSTVCDETVLKENILKGADLTLSYKELADIIVSKWFGNKKSQDMLLNPEYTFFGLGAKIDAKGKKVYISGVFGNYKSLNAGASRRDELTTPYSVKLMGLAPYDEKTCKKCSEFKNLVDLQLGLSVKDGAIYFKTNKLKELQRLLKEPKDGIAVDLVQKDQYPCTGENILDNTLPSKGILIKRFWSSDLFGSNLNKGKKATELEVKVGELPKELTGEYELNLIIIKDRSVCKNIARSFVAEAGLEYKSKVILLADTISVRGMKTYKPEVTSSVIKFKIPFEKGKTQYKQSDVEPVLKQLNEPDYKINEVNITAYSSIEGNADKNLQLQKERANSIINILAKGNKNIKTQITTQDNWELFKTDIATTEHAAVASMTLEDARNYIKEKNLADKLEPILSKERYADIEMKVTYDIDGNKEQTFVVSMFNKAIKKNDLAEALAIQKYIFKKVMAKQYNASAVTGMDIPQEKACAGLAMNKLWLDKWVKNEELSKEFFDKLKQLKQLDPSNPYIIYNYTFCDLMLNSVGDEKSIKEKQKNIDALYNSTITKPTIDNLNLECQLKIMRAYDSLATPHPLYLGSLEKIKKIVNVSESNWLSSLKLAYIFIGERDYEYAIKLLEPFIDDEKVMDEVLFTYITLCTKTPYRIQTGKFADAMRKARDLDKERYCKLISNSQLSFQVFDNLEVKTDYCKACKQ